MNYSENSKLKKSYDSVFRIAGSVVGVSNLTYEKYEKLSDYDKDRVKKFIEKNIKTKSNEDINELVDDINEEVDREDRISGDDAKKFFDLGKKIYPEKKKTSTKPKKQETKPKKIKIKKEKKEDNGKITIGKRALNLAKRTFLTVVIGLDIFSVIGLLVATSVTATPTIIATYATLPTITALYIGYKSIRSLVNYFSAKNTMKKGKKEDVEELNPQEEAELAKEAEKAVELGKEAARAIESPRSEILEPEILDEPEERLGEKVTASPEVGSNASEEPELDEEKPQKIGKHNNGQTVQPNSSYVAKHMIKEPQIEVEHSPRVKSSIDEATKTALNLNDKVNKYEEILKKENELMKSIEAIVNKDDLEKIPQYVAARNRKKEILDKINGYKNDISTIEKFTSSPEVEKQYTPKTREVVTNNGENKTIYIPGAISNVNIGEKKTYDFDEKSTYEKAFGESEDKGRRR